MVRRCIRLMRLTLVCEVIKYHLVQVRQNLKKKIKTGVLVFICHMHRFGFNRDLRSLDVWRLRTVTSEGVVALSEGCTKLQELDMGWM